VPGGLQLAVGLRAMLDYLRRSTESHLVHYALRWAQEHSRDEPESPALLAEQVAFPSVGHHTMGPSQEIREDLAAVVPLRI
jgi:hypothetical protein